MYNQTNKLLSACTKNEKAPDVYVHVTINNHHFISYLNLIQEIIQYNVLYVDISY